MKIVQVITRMILGGAQENTLLTCEGLHERGHELTLITGPARGPEGELLSRALAGGYKVIVLGSLRREINPFHDLSAYRALLRCLRRAGPDIVHTHSAKAGILGRRAAFELRRRGRVPAGMRIVHTIHGLPFHPYGGRLANRLYVAAERQAASRCDAIISVADAMTTQALAAGVGRPEQYTTIYSGMEIDSFTSAPEGVDEFRASLAVGTGDILVTQVSRLAELKGHQFILSAAGLIDKPSVHFCFVGDGRLAGRIARRIGREGLSGKVHLTGLLPPTRIPLVMHASDIVVHCSLREGLARAIPQAMLAGKPVISFDVDGAREAVDAHSGILLAARDVAGLAGAIDRLAGSAELRSRLGQAGRRRAREMFDHNLMANRIEALYRRLVESA